MGYLNRSIAFLVLQWYLVPKLVYYLREGTNNVWDHKKKIHLPINNAAGKANTEEFQMNILNLINQIQLMRKATIQQ